MKFCITLIEEMSKCQDIVQNVEQILEGAKFCSRCGAQIDQQKVMPCHNTFNGINRMATKINSLSQNLCSYFLYKNNYTWFHRASSLAWLEHPADNREVASSNLAWPIIFM